MITGCAPEHYIELRVINPRGGGIGRGFYEPGDPDLATDIAESDARRLNVYFAVGPRTEAGKGDRAHVAGLQAVYVDVDFKTLPPDRADALIDSLPLPPSALVLTGGGLHPYWLLSSFLSFAADGAFDRAKSLLRRLAIRLEADLAAAEPARILRVPGTYNQKYNPPRLVTIKYFAPGARYAITDFEDVLHDVRDDRAVRSIEWKEPPRADCAGTRPGDDFNARASWPTILEPHGWRLVHYCGEATYWRRPGKSDGISASVNYDGRGILWVFSSNAPPLEAGRGYTKFSAFAFLEHHGDFVRAARQLSRWGFGR
jgi:hypothetical protein